jgi:hypothetical protein
MRIQAEAAASNDRVALDRMLIDQLPEIVKHGRRDLEGGPGRSAGDLDLNPAQVGSSIEC